MNGETEKRRLEHEAARLFMREYEALTGQHMRHIWHNQPAKPDVSCYLDGQRLDLEIAHLYGSEKEAMHLLGRELGASVLSALHQLAETEVHERLTIALNRILAAKGEKRYQTDRVWLVLRNAHPAWNAGDIETARPAIRVPAQHPFEQIWILGDMQGQSGILPLYPVPEHPANSSRTD